MNELQAKGLILPDTRQDVVNTKIVLIVPKDSTGISDFKDLASDRVKTVALGDPKGPSAGIYTEETLTSLGILNQVKRKAVYSHETIRQVLRAVETKSVDAGIVYAVDAKTSNLVKVVATAPGNTHSPIVAPVAVLKNSKNIGEAKEFTQFLVSEKAGAVFEKYGFKQVEER